MKSEYEKWFDKNAKIYSRDLNKYTLLRRAEFIKEHAYGKVLDIGIGDGQVTSLYVNSKKIKQITGIDISKEMLKECRKRLKGVKLIRGDIESFFFKKSFFDTIVCSSILNYLKNPKVFIEKCKKMLKKNGRIIIIIHNPVLLFLEPVSVALKLTPKEYLTYKPHSSLEIISLLSESGFKNISIKSFCIIPFKGFKFLDKIFFNKFGFKIGITAIKN